LGSHVVPFLNIGVWYKNLDRSFFRFVTIHAFVRQTDGQTEHSSLDRLCIPCNAVKSMCCLCLCAYVRVYS